MVTQDGQEIGREEFTFRPTRGRGLPGTTIIAAARYPATSPTTRLAATLERTPDSALAKFQLDVESGGAVTVILAAGLGRAADRAHRGQGLRVRARAAGRSGRGPARRRGLLALPPRRRAGDAGGPAAHGDLSAHRQAGHVHRPPRVRRAGRRRSGQP